MDCDAARRASAPPDYVAMALLAVAGPLVGNACWVHPWVGWSEPPAIWAMLVGGPSCGKSPALRKVIEPLVGLERRVREQAEPTSPGRGHKQPPRPREVRTSRIFRD